MFLQPRLSLSSFSDDLVLDMSLAGLQVFVDQADNRYPEAFEALLSLGFPVSYHEAGSLVFPVSRLGLLHSLPSTVVLRPEPVLQTLCDIARFRDPESPPVTLSLSPNRMLLFRWVDALSSDQETLADPRIAAAFLATGIPFVATSEAWELLERSSRLPMRVGTARVNLDGFVEVHAQRPQMVEALPIPGLFRVDDTHFGVPLPYWKSLVGVHGLSFEGPTPPEADPVTSFTSWPTPLSHAVRQELPSLSGHLKAFGSAAVCWERGLGRRLLALAAVEVLDAWPLVVVCPPHTLWLYQRLLEAFGRTATLDTDLSVIDAQQADAVLVTYLDLFKRVQVSMPASLIFDEPLSKEATHPGSLAAARRFAMSDSLRMLVTSSFPADPTAAYELASLLRPQEFPPGSSHVWRYPGQPEKRLFEHVDAYLFSKQAPDRHGPPPPVENFQSMSCRTHSPSEDLQDLLNRLRLSPKPLSQKLLLASEYSTVGGPSVTSPKLAMAARVARPLLDLNRRLAFVTRHERVANLLKPLLRPYTMSVWRHDPSLPVGTRFDKPSDATVVVFEDQFFAGVQTPPDPFQTVAPTQEPVASSSGVFFPSLRNFDHVIVLDYPFCTSEFDESIAWPPSVTGPLGPDVTILHLEEDFEDRLAILFAKSKEFNGFELSSSQAVWLLAHRWSDT